MTKSKNTEDILKTVTEMAEKAAGVRVIHSPSPSAGEKVIYRYTPGDCGGDFEVLTVTMRFISRNIGDAVSRAERVTHALCSDTAEASLSLNGCPVFIQRKHSGGSGYIGKTGHYFVLASFEVRRRVPSEAL